jgi:acetyl-CoA carboxylase biotin carboxyl carrier protein
VLAAVRQHASGLAEELAGPVRRIRVRSGDVTIEVEWQPAGGPPSGANGHRAVAPESMPGSAPGSMPGGPGGPGGPGEPDGPGPAGRTAGRAVVTAPVVGTFYHASRPGADPFVRVGDTVDAEQTVGLVEAMKLMNPVLAETRGRVVEVLAGNGQPVEFGQPLIVLDPLP